MAPLKATSALNKEQRAREALDLARKTLDLLRARSELPASLQTDIDRLIAQSFPLRASAELAKNRSENDAFGCELWNAALSLSDRRLNNDDVPRKGDEVTRLVALLRVFAFFLVASAAAHSGVSKCDKDKLQILRAFNIGVKACRFCLEYGYLNYAQSVLGHCSEYVDARQQASPLVRIADEDEAYENETAMKALTCEFYLLRVTHAWKSGNIDVAEYSYNQILLSRLAESASLCEKAADVFFEVGKAMVENKATDIAIIWLERATQALDACAPEGLNQDAAELRLTLTSTLVQALLSRDSRESIDRAQSLLDQLTHQHEYSNRTVVHLLRLKMLLVQQPLQEALIVETISRLTHTTILNDRTFNTIIHAIHKIRRVTSRLACKVLHDFIAERLQYRYTESSNASYLERACVTYVYFATQHQGEDAEDVLQDLQDALDVVREATTTPFSTQATHAAQALIWKASGDADAHLERQWSALLRHPVFEETGQVNKARICRRAMNLAIESNELEVAAEAFYEMSTSAQNDPLSRYLAFKLALQTANPKLAVESLAVISQQAGTDQTALYACALETQQSEMKGIAIAALQAVLDSKPSSDRLPLLLRCTARLLIGDLDTNDRSFNEVMAEVIRIFESAKEKMTSFLTSAQSQRQAELQWWSKNAYNLAIQHCAAMHTADFARLLCVCVAFADAYLECRDSTHREQVLHRKALCHFLRANAFVTYARSAIDNSEDSLQSYLEARREIASFMVVTPNITGSKEVSSPTTKAFELLKFDLECILYLKQWGELGDALQACLDHEQSERWDRLADVVLLIRQHSESVKVDDKTTRRMNEVLDKIVNETWRTDRDIGKASRWLRLAFSMDLQDSEGLFALKLLKQATEMARKGSGRRYGVYPETELQWLATTSFNRAIDILSTSSIDGCYEWMTGALELARYSADGGALHASLTDKQEQVMEMARNIQHS